MTRTLKRSVGLLTATGLGVILAAFPLPALATSSVPSLVGELLEIDASQAVLAEQQELARRGGSQGSGTQAVSAAVAEPSVSPRRAPQLVAIYGVGTDRASEWTLGSVSARLRPGQRDPASGLRLVSIVSPCATVEWDGARETFCLGSP